MRRSAEFDRRTVLSRRSPRSITGPVLAAAFAMACTACLARPASAQPARSKAAPAASKAPATSPTQDAQAVAKLQARAHRILAKIVEAEAADKPNRTKIDALYADLQKVRTQMMAYGRAAGWGPGGGPGWQAGAGAGWRRGGGPGWGRGGGRGWRRGGGPGAARGGPGAGWGRGRGAAWGGRGPGWRGAGAARGAGANVGNCQPGQCQGPYWSDNNGNGVCDTYEGSGGTRAAPKKPKGK